MLEPILGEDASKEAAAQFSQTKKFVPTRAHPSAPNKPPYETLVGFMAMPVRARLSSSHEAVFAIDVLTGIIGCTQIDKLKDMFAKFPTEEMKANAKQELGE
jgi:hypothetical protein